MDEALLAARYGVYRDREAGAFGIRRRRDGTPVGHPMTRGVRCLLPPPWTVEARRTGAVLGGGVGAQLAGDSWLEAFGIDTPSPFAPVTVLIRHGCVKHTTRLAVYQRSRVLEPASHRERSFLTAALARDVGVASARSIVVHAGASFVHTELRGLLATLAQTGVTSPGAVVDFARLHPRLPGAAAARRVALDLANGADSEGEFQFLELARAAGLPADRGHVKIIRHGRVLSTTDGWWDAGVPGFFDGALHGRWASRQRDNTARTLMANAGLRPFVVTTQLRDDRTLFAASLRARIREAGEARVKAWRRVADGIELIEHA